MRIAHSDGELARPAEIARPVKSPLVRQLRVTDLVPAHAR